MLQYFFVFVKCDVGRSYEVGRFISKMRKDIIRRTSAISGDWDLLLMIEIDKGEDVGKIISGLFEDVPHIKKTSTVAAFLI